MKKALIYFVALILSMSGNAAFSQTGQDTTALGLPGDNLDLYAVLSLFQKSKTIEDFEKSLNLKETGINNLDLNLDNKVDFIKVTTKQKDDDFSFILQVDVTEKEVQDVAVILLDKDKDGKLTLQIVGDKDLYGKDYVIEPKSEPTPSVTANPAYTGDDPVTVNVPASTTVVLVESAPVVQYVYSPAYVPYYPPYYYAYYPPYFAAFTVMAVGIYRHNNYYHCHGYHGGHYGGGNVYIHNENNFNNYNNSRNHSNTVNNNRNDGRYGNNNGNRNNNSAGNNAPNRASVGNNASKGTSASTRQSGSSTSNRQSTKASTSNRASSSDYSSSNRSSSSRSSNYSQPSRSSSSYGGGRSGGYSGGSRGGGGGRGGRR